MVLVDRGVQPVVLDQALGETGAAQRVEARGDDGSDRGGVDLQAPDRLHGAAEKLLLDLRGPLLEVALEERLVEVQVAALDAAAGEDALGELVAGQPQPVERLPLRRLRPGLEHRQGGQRRAAASRAGGTMHVPAHRVVPVGVDGCDF